MSKKNLSEQIEDKKLERDSLKKLLTSVNIDPTKTTLIANRDLYESATALTCFISFIITLIVLVNALGPLPTDELAPQIAGISFVLITVASSIFACQLTFKRLVNKMIKRMVNKLPQDTRYNSISELIKLSIKAQNAEGFFAINYSELVTVRDYLKDPHMNERDVKFTSLISAFNIASLRYSRLNGEIKSLEDLAKAEVINESNGLVEQNILLSEDEILRYKNCTTTSTRTEIACWMCALIICFTTLLTCFISFENNATGLLESLSVFAIVVGICFGIASLMCRKNAQGIRELTQSQFEKLICASEAVLAHMIETNNSHSKTLKENIEEVKKVYQIHHPKIKSSTFLNLIDGIEQHQSKKSLMSK
ncbi:hypothetical protein [Vibrio harveyi]|uniref:hypothetical protein n=1 Tax=Vibrio harveyi TaxID=669 RepID=UPI003CF3C862